MNAIILCKEIVRLYYSCSRVNTAINLWNTRSGEWFEMDGECRYSYPVPVCGPLSFPTYKKFAPVNLVSVQIVSRLAFKFWHLQRVTPGYEKRFLQHHRILLKKNFSVRICRTNAPLFRSRVSPRLGNLRSRIKLRNSVGLNKMKGKAG